MAWTWRLEDAEGTTLNEPVSPTHGSQADAESWLGEEWRDLREAGVTAVTLLESGTKVYGPMSLSED